MDKEIQSQLYDPKKRRSTWLNFVMQHKNIKLPNGRINLKAISKLWKSRNKAYDPKKLPRRKYKWEIPEGLTPSETKNYIAYLNKLRKRVLSKQITKAYDPKPLSYTTLRKGMTLVDRAGDKYTIEKVERVGVPGRWKYVLKPLFKGADPDFRITRPYTEVERYYKLYDPHRLIETKEEGGREIPESHDHYHKNIKIYDNPKHGINRPPRRWFYAMLKGIEKRSDVRNPAAIVGSIWKRLSSSKRAEIKRKELQGKPFKYDLPLPDDRATHGTGTLRMVKPFRLAEVQVNVSLKDYLAALKSGLFQKMKRGDGSTALVARCKSDKKNCNIFVDKV